MKHSVHISGHNTSISLEKEFWDELKNIAAERRVSINELVAEADANRAGNLSSALRLMVLEYLKRR